TSPARTLISRVRSPCAPAELSATPPSKLTSKFESSMEAPSAKSSNSVRSLVGWGPLGAQDGAALDGATVVSADDCGCADRHWSSPRPPLTSRTATTAAAATTNPAKTAAGHHSATRDSLNIP